MSDAPLLQVERLDVHFGARQVVHQLSFAIAAGERFALVGESGSGKSVTALALLGLARHARVAGRVLWDGTDLLSAPDSALRALRGAQIGMIFQEPMTALNPLLSIGSQIAEVLRLHAGMGAQAARRRGIELLSRTGIADAARRVDDYPHQLSGGQRQRAMIAMALACRPRLLICDEPTTALDVTVQAQILALLQELQREMGLALLWITHDLPLVQRFCDRVGVMECGRLVECRPTQRLFAQPEHPYTRQLLASRPGRATLPPTDDSPVVLRARALSVRHARRSGWLRTHHLEALRPLDLDLRAGETLGIVGESGSGKTTLALALLGLQRLAAGEVWLQGTRLDRASGADLRRLRSQLQGVFQDPFAALSPRRTIGQIVEEGLLLHRPELDRAARDRAVADVLEEVGLSARHGVPDVQRRYPHEFSGGQRQRIAIARAIVLRPAVLVLDEPTSALDVTVQQQVLALLGELQRRHGTSYVFISHDLAVIRAVAHRVIVMQGGEVVEQGRAPALFGAPTQPYTRMLMAAAHLEPEDP